MATDNFIIMDEGVVDDSVISDISTEKHIKSEIIDGYDDENQIQIDGQVLIQGNKSNIFSKNSLIHNNLSGLNQNQKHIIVRRKSLTSNAQIVPLNTSNTQVNQINSPIGKHKTTLNVNKVGEPIVLSTTDQTATSSIAELPIQSLQSSKYVVNLMLPTTIQQQQQQQQQQQNEQLKGNMFKLNSNQINADSNGQISVLRESKSSNSSTNPPPLHPITKMGLLNKGNGNLSDSIKITENPDSAVITPIPNKEDPQADIKKKITNNVIRPSGEKRQKKQNLTKINNDSSIEITYTITAPETKQEREEREDRPHNNDDDITLIKVIPSQDKIGKYQKSSIDEDVKIEIIKSSSNNSTSDVSDKKCSETKVNNRLDVKELVNGIVNYNDPNFDATKVLNWKDGVGALPGSTLKFCINEFGLMEVVDDDENSKQDNHISIGDKENVYLSQNSSKSSPVVVHDIKKEEEKKVRSDMIDTLYCCEGCGCYGLAAEFESQTSCGPTCTEVIKQERLRRENEARELREKRKRKQLLKEQEKLLEKELDQIKIEKSPEHINSDEDIATIDDESDDSNQSKYPWLTGKTGFSWAKYLECTKSKAAPTKLFKKDAFPYSKTLFRVGMKLEGIDPEHPSRFCVLTVFEVIGYRLRLHFDGYPENFDFWINADSNDIFPAGWAEKNNHKLDPPKGYLANNFNWNAYLKSCKSTPAPKHAFATHTKSTINPPTGFRVGMKLEAVDRKHSTSVCVASIAGIIDNRILVHFDSWDEVYDYWADPTSPYIHPVGWCHHNGVSLTPPNNYKNTKFTWDSYLRETNSIPAPSRAFKQRPPSAFKRGMKLEAVDKRVPQIIRVATVEDVRRHVLKIRFDGWPESHAYWVEDDSPDIHPVSWCQKTGHPLEPPLTPEDLTARSECGTPGCRGIGHVKGPKFSSHNSASGCPYSPQNLHKLRITSDRLNIKHEICDYDEDSLDKSKSDRTSDKVKEKLSGLNYKNLKLEKDIKQEPEEILDKYDRIELNSDKRSKQHNSDDQSDEENTKRRRKRRYPPEDSNYSNFGDPLSTTNYSMNIPDKKLRREIYQSVYNPGYKPLPDAPHIWAKHSNALNRVVSKQNTNPRRWSNEEVIKFVQSVPNCKEVSNIFRKNNIDGEAFLMLTQEDLVSLLSLRLGPAIKLYNSIVLLRRKAT